MSQFNLKVKKGFMAIVSLPKVLITSNFLHIIVENIDILPKSLIPVKLLKGYVIDAL